MSEEKVTFDDFVRSVVNKLFCTYGADIPEDFRRHAVMLFISEYERFREMQKDREPKTQIGHESMNQQKNQDWSQGMRVSMAYRLRHDFGLLTDEEKLSILNNINRIWEEFSGNGFYKPENENSYAVQYPKVKIGHPETT